MHVLCKECHAILPQLKKDQITRARKSGTIIVISGLVIAFISVTFLAIKIGFELAVFLNTEFLYYIGYYLLYSIMYSILPLAISSGVMLCGFCIMLIGFSTMRRKITAIIATKVTTLQ
jgi:hypothetical protein